MRKTTTQQSGTAEIPPPAKPRAYSYLRFSTPEQAKGDSQRRQAEAAARYSEQHGLELDQTLTFQDLGISAYRGRNAEDGRLGDFLEAVREGIVAPGSYLLVESLDRISRRAPRKAFRVLEDIIDAGVNVVTLIDGRLFTQENLDGDQTTLLLSLLTFIRAHEESATKGRRVREAWSAKRRKAATEVLTARGPAWLKVRMGESGRRTGWDVIDDRAEVVRTIFQLALEGTGQEAIAATLNKAGVKPFGRGARWHKSSVAKILRNTAVVGTYSPHEVSYDEITGRKLRAPSGEPIEGYYPTIVDEAVFRDVQALLWSSPSGEDGGEARSRGPAHRPGHVTHWLAGLARCALCGSAMTRVFKGKRGGKPKLVCTNAKVGGGCQYVGVDIAAVEERLSEELERLVWNAPTGDATVDERLEQVETNLSAIEDAIEKLTDIAASGIRASAGDQRGRGVLLAKLSALDEERAALKLEQEALRKRAEAVSQKAVEKRKEQLLAALRREGEPSSLPDQPTPADKGRGVRRSQKRQPLSGETTAVPQIAEAASPLERAQVVNARLRMLLEGVEIDPLGGTLRLHWMAGGVSETVMFAWPKWLQADC